jgi:hypothetical protein
MPPNVPMFDKKVALMCAAEEPFVGFWRVPDW